MSGHIVTRAHLLVGLLTYVNAVQIIDSSDLSGKGAQLLPENISSTLPQHTVPAWAPSGAGSACAGLYRNPQLSSDWCQELKYLETA